MQNNTTLRLANIAKTPVDEVECILRQWLYHTFLPR